MSGPVGAEGQFEKKTPGRVKAQRPSEEISTEPPGSPGQFDVVSMGKAHSATH